MATKQAPSVSKNKSSTFVIRFVVIGIVVFVGAIFLGKSDKGVIDVSEAITNSNNNRQTQEDGSISELTPVPSEFSRLPNGGLVPSGEETRNIPPPAEETPATTTDSSGGDENIENTSAEITEELE